MKKISIIIPAYNVSDYIEQCLNSLVRQNMDDELEVIIVNDGSTDDTYQKCQQFIEEHKKWILIDKENGGLSSARNAGLKIATGEYIAFLDSDDYLADNVLKKMYLNAKENNSDILIAKLNAFDSDGVYGYYSDKYLKKNKSFTFYENKKIIKVVNVVGKLFKKELIKDIEFINGVIHEDNYFSILSYTKADTITTLDEYVYYRRIREGKDKSITQNLSLKTYCDLLFNYKKAIIDAGQIESLHFIVFFCLKASLRYIINNIDKKEKKQALNKHFEFIEFLLEKEIISKLKNVFYKYFSTLYFRLGSLAKVLKIV